MLGVFYCSEKGQATPRNGSAGLSHGRRRQAAGEAGTKCCPQERGYHGHGTSGELAPDTHGQTSYFFCTYRGLQGDCGIFLFDTFLSLFPTDYKRIQCFYDRRTWNSSGALFLRFWLQASAAVQGPCAPSGLENCLTKFQDWRKSE